jgi:hypothetical protein
MRRLLMIICLSVAAGACGSDDSSLTEYVDNVDAVFAFGLERYEALLATPEGGVLVAPRERLSDYTTGDLHVALEQLADIQRDALDLASRIDPPDELADLHVLFFRRLPIDELAARAATAATWEELSDSAEMAAYRNALMSDEVVCADLQAEIDATSSRDVFADNPWLPAEMKEIVVYALGCGSMVENPQDVYRPVTTAAP